MHASRVARVVRSLRSQGCHHIEILTDIFFAERAPFHSLAFQSSTRPITLTRIFFLAAQSSHLKHATFGKLKPSFFVVSTCQPPPNTSHALSKKLSKPYGGAPGPGAPGSGAPGYGRTWVHLIAFSTCGLKICFSFFRKSHPAS